MTTCYAIRRPDGTIILETIRASTGLSWRALDSLVGLSTDILSAGFKCVRVRVEEIREGGGG